MDSVKFTYFSVLPFTLLGPFKNDSGQKLIWKTSHQRNLILKKVWATGREMEIVMETSLKISYNPVIV